MTKPIIFIGGRSDTGKTASLRKLRDPEGVLVLNCEAKDLPFKSKFQEVKVTDPYTLHVITEKLIADGLNKYHTIVVDSITACMALFATIHIGKNCTNKMAAWGDYGAFYEEWAKQMVPKLEQTVIVLAHIADYEDEDTLKTYTQAVVQGKLKKIGLEADFGLVANTEIVPIHELQDFDNPLLNITEEEEIEGFKYVLQTRKTLETKDTKIRAHIGMWDKSETYVDADVQIILDKYKQFMS